MQDDEVSRALDSSFAVIQVMGAHAGESAAAIIRRKTEDISHRGARYTLWAEHSRLAKPHHVVTLCQRAQLVGEEAYFIIIDNSGSPPTSDSCAATHYRPEGTEAWQSVSHLNISAVTENASWLKSGKAYAIAIGELHSIEHLAKKLSMADWADATTEELRPAKTGQGHAVVCVERRDMRHHEEARHKERKIVAVARILEPYAVWLRRDA